MTQEEVRQAALDYLAKAFTEGVENTSLVGAATTIVLATQLSRSPTPKPTTKKKK